jgi:hypothetical protein
MPADNRMSVAGALARRNPLSRLHIARAEGLPELSGTHKIGLRIGLP